MNSYLARRVDRGRSFAALLLLAAVAGPGRATDAADPTASGIATLPGTRPLELAAPLDVFLLDGLHRHADRALVEARERRHRAWNEALRTPADWPTEATRRREELRRILGIVDARRTAGDGGAEFELNATLERSAERAVAGDVRVFAVRWPVVGGVDWEGLVVRGPSVRAAVVALPDAAWTPEQLCGLVEGVPHVARLVRSLAAAGCLVVVPALLGRGDEFSGRADVALTNQTHREFLYRQAFEAGRHPIGYEVQATLAAVDLCTAQLRRTAPERGDESPRIGVLGVGQGGLTALYATALDERVRATLVCGYFQTREGVWREPLDRNVWRLLVEHGDAELAGLVAPRSLVVEACAVPETAGPPAVRAGRRASAAPGRVVIPPWESVREEFARARSIYRALGAEENCSLAASGPDGRGDVGGSDAFARFVIALGAGHEPPVAWSLVGTGDVASRMNVDARERERRLLETLQTHVQTLVRRSGSVRERLWGAEAASPTAWPERRKAWRRRVHDELIGRLPIEKQAGDVRTRRIVEHERYDAYEVLIPIEGDLFAGGVLLSPKGLAAGERRPVVVCQHGLEGVARDVFSRDPAAFRYYKAFGEELCLRGFVVFAPQNPYRGEDRFRSLQRKANPLGRSLFSYIVAQHERTLEWLAGLPQADPERIAFYGLSYGGKTAMRVPPLLDRYRLAICSGDFTDWPRVIATNEDRYGYAFTGEYEIPEWNLAHVASYAELAMLMAPRPFMVEQGHRDGGTPSDWTAGEFGKVRRHYDQLGIGERATIEFFDGPHTIYGRETFRFLERHLGRAAPPLDSPP